MKAPSTPWPVTSFVDDGGREFRYVVVRQSGATTVGVHFSAFFGDWGDPRRYREQFGGYFHRLKMLGEDTSRHWLFLCDSYGAFRNGSYYAGEKGDLFVERAITQIIERTFDELGVSPDQAIFAGSSMGATGALKFGLRFGALGVVAVAPHIDLDVCAQLQNRWREVAFICPDGDPMRVENRRYTRQIGNALAAWGPSRRLPRLFIQSARDDVGVHQEQVLPLVELWRRLGGRVELDERRSGGHTSDWATRALLLDVFARIEDGTDAPVSVYQTDAPFLGVPVRPPLEHRLRRWASLRRKALSRRLGLVKR